MFYSNNQSLTKKKAISLVLVWLHIYFINFHISSEFLQKSNYIWLSCTDKLTITYKDCQIKEEPGILLVYYFKLGFGHWYAIHNNVVGWQNNVKYKYRVVPPHFSCCSCCIWKQYVIYIHYKGRGGDVVGETLRISIIAGPL